MRKTILILEKDRTNFTNLFYSNVILDTDIDQKKITEIKKKNLLPYVLPKGNFDKLLHNNIKVIIWNDHPFSINNKYDHFLKKYNNFLTSKRLFISTFDCYKHLVKNFIPPYAPKSLKIKIKKELFYNKKSFDLIFLCGDNKIKFIHYILYFSIYLISIFFWKKKFLLKNIFKKPFVKFLSNLSLGSTRTKYFILMSFMKNFRRSYIKKELEKIGNINIFYSGSKKFAPFNAKSKYDWIDEKNSSEVFSKAKLIIATESFCDEPNERIRAMKFGCLPIIEDNYWIKKKKIDKNLFFDFNKKDLGQKIRLILTKKDQKMFFKNAKLIASQSNQRLRRLRYNYNKSIKKNF
jgi:hypothetical protein